MIGFCGFRDCFEPPDAAQLSAAASRDMGGRGVPSQPGLFYGLTRSHWGRGVATEAARTILPYAFDHLGFKSVVAATDPPNTASMRVLEGLGVRLEGEVLHGGAVAMHCSLTKVQFGRRHASDSGNATGAANDPAPAQRSDI